MKAALILLLVAPLGVLAQKHVSRTLIQDGERYEVSYRLNSRSGVDPLVECFWVEGSKIHSAQGAEPASGRLHGSFERYDRDGQLLVSGAFEHGTKTGTWRAWDASGALLETAEWSGGKKNGWTHSYDRQGKLASSQQYRAGVLHGKTLIYQSDGAVITSHYRKGEAFSKPSRSLRLTRLPRMPKKAKPSKSERSEESTTESKEE